MAKLSAHRQSASAVMKASKLLKKDLNKTWNLAPKAPMFTRKSKNQQGKKKVVRTKRLIGGHAYKIVASGAAAHANAVLQREANHLRISIGTESKRVPWLPAVSKGAIALIEQFLCAYSQEATRHAVSVRVGVTDAKRLNGRFLKMGYDQADQDIFGAAMPAPRNVIVCKPDSKTKKGEKKEDGDFQAPPEAE